MSTPTPSFHSRAWLLDGPIDSLPGVLSLQDGRIRFLAHDAGTFPAAKLARTFARFGGNVPADAFPAMVIDVPRADLRSFRCPWYYFSGGIILDLAGQEARFSFLQPQNTLVRPHWVEEAHAWIGGDTAVISIAEGRAAGLRWRELLAA